MNHYLRRRIASEGIPPIAAYITYRLHAALVLAAKVKVMSYIQCYLVVYFFSITGFHVVLSRSHRWIGYWLTCFHNLFWVCEFSNLYLLLPCVHVHRPSVKSIISFPTHFQTKTIKADRGLKRIGTWQQTFQSVEIDRLLIWFIYWFLL